jgi:hypothetical protein
LSVGAWTSFPYDGYVKITLSLEDDLVGEVRKGAANATPS